MGIPYASKFHFARLTLSCPPNTSVFLPHPLTPLHFPVLARPRPFLARSSPVPRPASPGPRPASPGLARSSPGPCPALVSSNLAVKTGKREIYYHTPPIHTPTKCRPIFSGSERTSVEWYSYRGANGSRTAIHMGGVLKVLAFLHSGPPPPSPLLGDPLLGFSIETDPPPHFF